jgi:hypothetical protein
LAACGAPGESTDTGDSSETGDSAIPIRSVPQEGACDNLNPLHCLLPWPSDRYLVDDPSTVTGYRLEYDEAAVPLGEGATGFDVSPYARLDGMSPASQLMTLFPIPPDLNEAPFHDSIERSLDVDAQTLLLDLETGERLPHWVELDIQATSESETVLYMRLTERLEPNHAYAVGFRNLKDLYGDPLSSSDAFIALRDGIVTDAEDIEARRESYEDMFERFESADIVRSELQAAWRFHTASNTAISQDLLAIRKDALERIGADGIGCTIEEIEEPYSNDGLESFRKVTGTYTVPSYMESATPPTRMARDKAGDPIYVEDVEVPFTFIIPNSVGAVDEPSAVPLVNFGHGLMGNAEGTLSSGSIRGTLDEIPYVMVGTDWAGMSSNDIGAVAGALLNVTDFPNVSERLQQGMINQITLTRSIQGACRELEALSVEGVPVTSTDEVYFVGVSQGGIYGGTLVPISPDIERATLLVNGAMFPFMIERSIDFIPYMPYFESAYPNRMERAVMLPLAQHLWDTTDPITYMGQIADGVEGCDPECGPKTILSIAAENDAQVPNLASDIIMREAGAVNIVGSSRADIFGFENVDAPFSGTGYITMDLGDREVPEGNESPTENDDGHSTIGSTEPAIEIIRSFLTPNGEIVMPCDDECDPD